jgi:hypothetical protein
VSAWDALAQTMKPETSEVAGHLTGAVGVWIESQDLGDVVLVLPLGEAHLVEPFGLHQSPDRCD